MQEADTKNWWKISLKVEEMTSPSDFHDQLKRHLDDSEYVLIYQADVKTTHAVYVQCYNSELKMVTCMNSLGLKDELPRIELDKVQRLYKVTCKGVEDNNIGNKTKRIIDKPEAKSKSKPRPNKNGKRNWHQDCH